MNKGRRLPDTVESYLPDGYDKPGAYWKVLSDDGTPKRMEAEGKLTDECWRVTVPIGGEEGYAIANLDRHTVREHDDGTISVRPGDGSSNSILVTSRYKGVESTWHGYIEHGVFQRSG